MSRWLAPAEVNARRQAPTDPLLWHLTCAQNLAGIIRRGLIAPADVEDPSDAGDIVWLGDPRRRKTRSRTCFSGAAPQEAACYVPFNFATRTHFHVRVGLNAFKGAEYEARMKGQYTMVTLDPDDLCYLQTRVSHFVGATVRFTDGNIAVGSPRHYGDLADLGNLRWDVISAPPLKKSEWQQRQRFKGDLLCWDQEWREASQANDWHRSAEFLIARSVPFAAIEAIHVSSAEAGCRLERVLNGLAIRPMVIVSPQRFPTMPQSAGGQGPVRIDAGGFDDWCPGEDEDLEDFEDAEPCDFDVAAELDILFQQYFPAIATPTSGEIVSLGCIDL